LSGLPPAARDLAAALAVVNQRSPLSTVGRVAGIPAPVEALQSLLSTGFVRWEPAQPGPPIEFSHPLYRLAVYEDLSPTRRRDLHRSAARVLTPGSVLAHRVAAADGADEALADELDAIATAEHAVGAIGQAALHLLWASSLTENPQRAQDRLLEAALAFLDAGESTQAVMLKGQILRGRESALRSFVLGLIDWECGAAATAKQHLLQATEGRIAPADRVYVARAYAQLAELYVTAGDAGKAVAAAGKALDQSVRDTPAERLAWILLATGEGMLSGGPAGLERLRARLPEAPGGVVDADIELLITRANINYYSDRGKQSRADLDAIFEMVRRGIVPVQLARCHYLMALVQTNTGEWDDAELHARTALSIAADDRLVWVQSQCHAALATLLAYRGEFSDAEVHLQLALETTHGVDDVEAVARAQLAGAALGRARDNAAAILEALDGLQSVAPQLSALYFWPSLVCALIDTGQLERAGKEIDAFRVAADGRGIDSVYAILGLRARLAAAAGDADGATGLFEKALAQPRGQFLERALLRHAFAKLLLARGHRRLAAEHFHVAQQMLVKASGKPFSARIEADLSAAHLDGQKRPVSPLGFELTWRCWWHGA
jgi:tetratricopeptide (TPR) repeat protein